MMHYPYPEWVTVVADRTPSVDGVLYPEEAEAIADAAEKRRVDYTSGRQCARRALARLGCEDVPLVNDTDGVPHWPSDVVGSITHTDGLTAVAVAPVSRALGIGIDIERVRNLDAGVAVRILRPAERAWIDAQPPAERDRWTMLVFSAKECVYKCIYPLERKFLEFHDVQIALEPQTCTFTAALIKESEYMPNDALETFSAGYTFDPPYIITGVVLPASPSRARQVP